MSFCSLRIRISWSSESEILPTKIALLVKTLIKLIDHLINSRHPSEFDMSQSHQIRVGDCIDIMRTLLDESVNTCVTSPCYQGLRDYGVEGQIGLEGTPAEFIARLVDVWLLARD
ncbi:hypothetical protein AO252_11775 [Pseudomonas syringae pv. cerasicola]|nr:hypothetical protein AO272_02415 [Pseudomonas syringae pv. cerasicola]PHN79661.1 hypothetical protein AO252_11775 [Pseudomonas syringae pv. cerasicola]